MFVVPTGPGRSRVLWWLIVHADGLPAPFRALAGLKPRWADHLTRNLVFDGDNIILHIQVSSVTHLKQTYCESVCGVCT